LLFEVAEDRFARLREYLFDALSRLFDEIIVSVDEFKIQPPGEQLADGCLAGAAITYEEDIHGTFWVLGSGFWVICFASDV